MRKLLLTLTGALLLVAGTATAAQAPETIRLPDGYQPEGIAAKGRTLYVGSIPTGAVSTVDPRSGRVEQLVRPREGRAAIGVEVAGNTLYVAGGPTGRIFVYDARDGDPIRSFDVDGGFVNDVVVRGRTAYFTDSQKRQFYVVRGSKVTTVPITGDFTYGQGFNANGIELVGDDLVIVKSSTGELFRVDPRTGDSERLRITGEATALPNGDGLTRVGDTLYVVQNRLNRIAVTEVEEDDGRIEVEVEGFLTDDDFDVPTTVAKSGDALYAPNARFGTANPGSARFDVVRVDREDDDEDDERDDD